MTSSPPILQNQSYNLQIGGYLISHWSSGFQTYFQGLFLVRESFLQQNLMWNIYIYVEQLLGLTI